MKPPILLPSLGVGIACYNDSSTIGPIIDESYAAAVQLAQRVQILVVDDGSTDTSVAILQGLQSTRPWLEVRVHAHNLGFGPTFAELYTWGACDYAAFLPGDGQLPASQIAVMAAKIGGCDIVLGLRSSRQDNLRRRLNSIIYNSVVSSVAGRWLGDVNSISLWRTDATRGIKLQAQSAFIHAEFLLEAHRVGLRITPVSIQHAPRRHGGGQGGRVSVILPTIGELAVWVSRNGPVWIK